MSEIRILGVLVKTQSEAALKVQEILTKYGCSIRTRLGLHTPVPQCDSCGLIILELTGNMEECIRLENELWALDGVKVQKMVF
ncbi:MAG: hypothetical protein EA394_08590 [Bacteroidia bacterium]|nr:MAG: hypothetical protein EA394_08590 [Bacteroidia bacterium]